MAPRKKQKINLNNVSDARSVASISSSSRVSTPSRQSLASSSSFMMHEGSDEDQDDPSPAPITSSSIVSTKKPRQSTAKTLPFQYLPRIEFNPYTKHNFMVTTILFNLDNPTEEFHMIPRSIGTWLTTRINRENTGGIPLEPKFGSKYDVKDLKKDERWIQFYELLSNLINPIITSAGASQSWYLFSAYNVLITSNKDAVYRNKQFPSWDVKVKIKEGAKPRSIANMVVVPTDVAFLVLTTLFGTDGWAKDQYRLSTFPTKLEGVFRPGVLEWWKHVSKHYTTNQLVEKIRRSYDNFQLWMGKCDKVIEDLEAEFGQVPQDINLTEQQVLDKLNACRVPLKKLGNFISKWCQDYMRVYATRRPSEELKSRAVKFHEFAAKLDLTSQDIASLVPSYGPELADVIADIIQERDRVLGEGDKEADDEFAEDQRNLYGEDEPEGSEFINKNELAQAASIFNPIDNTIDSQHYGMSFLYTLNDQELLNIGGFGGKWPGVAVFDLQSQKEPKPKINIFNHQLAGAIRIVQRAYSGTGLLDPSTKQISGKSCCLVADGVGLGKTLLSVLVILAFNNLGERFSMLDNYSETSNAPKDRPHAMDDLPPIMLKNPGLLRSTSEEGNVFNTELPMNIRKDRRNYDFFAATKKYAPPRSPHILICPNVLVKQWDKEIRRFAPDSLRVLRLSHPDGEFTTVQDLEKTIELWKKHEQSKKHKKPKCPSQYLILISDVVLIKLWLRQSNKGLLTRPTQHSIFQLDFCTLIADEAHLVRSPGNLQSAIFTLSGRASFRLALTGTPVYNGPLDVCHWANALQFDGMTTCLNSPSGKPKFYQTLASELAKQNDVDRERRTLDMQTWFQATDAASGHLNRKLIEAKFNDRLRDDLGLEKSEVDSVKEAAIEVFQMVTPMVIRRTRNSLDKFNKPLVPRRPREDHIVLLQQTAQEVKDVEDFLEKIHEQNNDGRIKKRKGSEIIEKDTLAYAGPAYNAVQKSMLAPAYYHLTRLPDEKKGDNVQRWYSTKAACIVQIIKDKQEEEDRNNVPEHKRVKFGIHCVSVEAIPFYTFWLAYHNLRFRSFTGKTPAKERDEILEQIDKDSDHESDPDQSGTTYPTRIVWLSSLAEAGLNIPRIDIVFRLSLNWSYSSYEQSIGRHDRLFSDSSRPTRPLLVYSLFVSNSSDSILLDCILSKSKYGDMFENPDAPPEDEIQSDAVTKVSCPNKRKLPRNLKKGRSAINEAQSAELEELGITCVFDNLYRPKTGFWESFSVELASTGKAEMLIGDLIETTAAVEDEDQPSRTTGGPNHSHRGPLSDSIYADGTGPRPPEGFEDALDHEVLSLNQRNKIAIQRAKEYQQQSSTEIQIHRPVTKVMSTEQLKMWNSERTCKMWIIAIGHIARRYAPQLEAKDQSWTDSAVQELKAYRNLPIYLSRLGRRQYAMPRNAEEVIRMVREWPTKYLRSLLPQPLEPGSTLIDEWWITDKANDVVPIQSTSRHTEQRTIPMSESRKKRSATVMSGSSDEYDEETRSL